jgi:hypothetical protein
VVTCAGMVAPIDVRRISRNETSLRASPTG